MKRFKKFFSLLLVLTMIMSFAVTVPVSAAGEGSITINIANNIHTLEGFTFEAYKVFDLVPGFSPLTGEGYAYVITPEFRAFDDYPDSDTKTLAEYIRTLTSHSDEMNELAANLWAYIETKGIAPAGRATGGAGATSVTITDLDIGYYLVYGTGEIDGLDGKETIVAACALTTTDLHPEINIKADVPEIEKKVWDDKDKIWKDWTDVNIGDTVQFKLESKVPVMTGYESYTFTVHDIMSPGLTFDPTSVVVKINDVVFTDYDVVCPAPHPAPAPDCTFDLVFDPDVFVTLTPGHSIVITYEAMLNDEAVIAAPGNPNTVHLEFSNDPYTDGTGRTPDSTVKVFTYWFEIFKHTEDHSKEPYDPGFLKGLAGAKFILCTDITDETTKADTTIKFVRISAGSATEPAIYRVATPDEITAGTGIETEIVSPESGFIHLRGLDLGVYYLIETVAPDGYKLLDAPIKVEIIPWGTPGEGGFRIRINDRPPTGLTPSVPVENIAGSKFPETGGIGTAIFTVGGLLIMAGAVLALFIRRRRASLNV